MTDWDRRVTGCQCWYVDEKYWFTHYGAVEPGSQMEWNPECPVHPPRDDEAPVSQSQDPGLSRDVDHPTPSLTTD